MHCKCTESKVSLQWSLRPFERFSYVLRSSFPPRLVVESRKLAKPSALKDYKPNKFGIVAKVAASEPAWLKYEPV